MTRLIEIRSVIIPPARQRQEFDPVAMQDLINSITDTGLMHAPVLRESEEGWKLVAGERRLRAMTDIHILGGRFRYDGQIVPEGMIPYTTMGDLSPLEAEEAELDENLKRKDLTWQEHSAAMERLHKLRSAQKQEQRTALVKAGLPNGVALNEIPLQTVADTALEIHGRSDGRYQDEVRKELIVARHLSNPAIAKAKDVHEAFKILKAQEQTKRNEALAEAVGQTFSAADHALHNVSCIDFLAGVESRFDVICTDPPYGMGADSFGDGGGKLTGITHRYDDSYESWKSLLQVFARLAYRAAKPKAHAYLFCDFDRFHELKGFMVAAGWDVFRTPIVIHKLGSGRVPRPDCGPRRQWELVLYAIKGGKPVTHIYPDVISAMADESTGHGAQKPVAVIQNLLQRSVGPGDEVFDGFAGSGSIFPAAHAYQCKVTACELDQASYGISLKRLQALSAQGDMLKALES
jgi:DNA modification methylase/ParB-like chromosome segregation protein Spo0J